MSARSKWSAEARRAYNYARNHSPAGLARRARYYASEKFRAWRRAYDHASPKRRAWSHRRIWIGHDYAGVAATVEQARMIQAHIRRRKREFAEGQRCSVETVGKSRS